MVMAVTGHRAAELAEGFSESEPHDAMNTLRFQLEKIDGDDGTPFWDAELLADDLLVNDGWSLDWIDLARSAFLPGGYFPLTCSCGVPECARLHQPVQITHQGNLIDWHIIEPKPERHFRFDKAQYRSAILDFLREVQRIVPRPEPGEPFGFGHVCFWVTDLDWCVKTLETGIVDDMAGENSE